MANQVAVPFNALSLTGREKEYLSEALESGHLCGNGPFSKRCAAFFQERFGVKKALLTTSCTDALEMAALLCRIESGDEVILPSYTFVSTANAFALRGAKLKFADSESEHPNISTEEIRRLLSPKTKAVVVVHYGGVGCRMEEIVPMVREAGAYLVEDAAQAVDCWYQGQALGTFGHFGSFSFHQTKNIIGGEAGLLAVNDGEFAERAEILWEKGTDRSKFVRGEIDKYGWVDIGSSFLASELPAAVLCAQLEGLKELHRPRLQAWDRYRMAFEPEAKQGRFSLLPHSAEAVHNAHLFAIVCRSLEQRNRFLDQAREARIGACFHYVPLHSSPYFRSRYDGPSLSNADRFGDCLVRLPMFNNMTSEQVDKVVEFVLGFEWE